MANTVTYGFYDLQSVFSQRVTDSMIPTINTAIDRTIAEHNRQSNALFNLLVRQTTQYKLRYRTPGSETLQPGDENGRYLPTQGGSTYDVAFPLQFAGTAWGANRTARIKMTVEEVNNILAQKLLADIRWRRNHILATLFASASWEFTDKEHGALTIMPVANGDSQVYAIQAGTDSGATDDHLYKQAAAIADATNPFPTIYDELMEHPENGGEPIAFISSSLRATTEALATFKEYGDPDITVGIGNDRLTGRLGVSVPGTVIGKADKVWIVEWKSLPAGYGFAVTSGGEPVIGARQQPEPELQGFQRIGSRQEVPFTEDQYERQEGYGIWNRVGAVPFRIGNASYAVPTGYSVPMP
jgi:hypothetical protein